MNGNTKSESTAPQTRELITMTAHQRMPPAKSVCHDKTGLPQEALKNYEQHKVQHTQRHIGE